MSETLTESSTFAASVSVPTKTDPGNNRAALIKVALQALTNRTRWLKNTVDALPAAPDLSDYARKSVANIFTAAQRVNSTLRVTGETTLDAQLHATTIEASSTISGASITSLGGVTAASDIISTGGGVTTSGAIVSATAVSGPTLTAVSGDITLAANRRVRYSGSVADRTRRELIPLCLAQVCLQSTGALSDARIYDDHILATGADVYVRLPLTIPPEAELLSISMFHSAQHGSNRIQLVRKEIADWDTLVQTGGPSMSTTLDQLSTTGPDNRITRVAPAPAAPPYILTDVRDWTIKIHLAQDNKLYGVRIEYALATVGG